MAFHSNYSCDECGTKKGPFYDVAFRRILNGSVDGVEEIFQVCTHCVRRMTWKLPRSGAVLPAIPTGDGPLCKWCNATEYLEGSQAQYCSNGHYTGNNPEWRPETVPPPPTFFDRVLGKIFRRFM